MAESKEKVRGYLVISAREASGKNKEEKVVWDPSFVEGFVKGTHSPQCRIVQATKHRLPPTTQGAPLDVRVPRAQLRVRGGPRNVKVRACRHDASLEREAPALLQWHTMGCVSNEQQLMPDTLLVHTAQVQSAPKRVLANSLSWDERLTLCAPCLCTVQLVLASSCVTLLFQLLVLLCSCLLRCHKLVSCAVACTACSPAQRHRRWQVWGRGVQGGAGGRNRAAAHAVPGEAHGHARRHVRDRGLRCAQDPCETTST